MIILGPQFFDNIKYVQLITFTANTITTLTEDFNKIHCENNKWNNENFG